MPRFLTASWAEAVTGALADVRLPDPGPDAGLAAVDGTFVVAEEVRGAPDGDVRLVLQADAGTLRLRVAPLGEGDEGEDEDEVDVTIAIGYDDAVALSLGTLSPAEALNAGRIRVRGDLSVLVAGQELLRVARTHTAAVDADTTY